MNTAHAKFDVHADADGGTGAEKTTTQNPGTSSAYRLHVLPDNLRKKGDCLFHNGLFSKII